jgi:hypothetical protein
MWHMRWVGPVRRGAFLLDRTSFAWRTYSINSSPIRWHKQRNHRNAGVAGRWPPTPIKYGGPQTDFRSTGRRKNDFL